MNAFNGGVGHESDIVSLNDGAAIYVAGLTSDLASGVDRARQVMQSSEAAQKLSALAALTQGF